MTGLVDLLGDLARQTFRDPQGAARRLIAIDPPMEARWLALLLVGVLAVLETRLALLAMPVGDPSPVFAVVADPWIGVPAQILSLALVAMAIAGIGRMFGGAGRFADALLLVVWLEFLLTLVQAVQMVVMFVMPPLGTLLALAAIGLFLWLMVQFIAALHGFHSRFKVFVGMVAGFILIVTAMAMLLAVFGIVAPV